MRIYRESYTSKSGEVKKAQKWYIDFRDNLNRRHKLAGFNSKRPTEDLARQIEGLISGKSGNSGLTAEQQRWIDGLPDGLLNNLIKWGLIDGQRAEGNKPLSVHLENWKNSILAGSTKKHAEQKYNRVSKIFKLAGFNYYPEISGSKLQLQISKLKRTVKTKDSRGKLVDKIISDSSNTTKNEYLKACKQFCRWAQADGRAGNKPLEYLKPSKTTQAQRSAFEPDELRQLLTHTNATGTSFGLTGHQRAVLYRFAAETGFRATEIRSLKVQDIDFNNNIVMLSGQFTKNNKEASLPIKPATA